MNRLSLLIIIGLRKVLLVSIKPFLYNASVIVDGTEKDAERIKGFFGATIILKKTERTTIGVGLIVLVDPTSPVPASPTFLIDHRFKNSKWSLDFILPQRFLFKRKLIKRNNNLDKIFKRKTVN